MKYRIIGILLFLVFFFSVPCNAWIATNIYTKNGIRIILSKKVAEQYERYWQSSFHQIQWDDIDQFFALLAEAYGVPEADPTKLKVKILLFDEEWTDNELAQNADGTVGREMVYGRYGHIDGVYWNSTITIHLGDDAGKGELSFCQTALDWELWHHFERVRGSYCWKYEFADGCPERYISAWSITGLCK